MDVVYILECVDGSWYTGWTNQLEKRLLDHQNGTASKYTRSKLPVRLMVEIRCHSPHQARSIEYRFKKLTRKKKEQYIENVDAFLAWITQKEEAEIPRIIIH